MARRLLDAAAGDSFAYRLALQADVEAEDLLFVGGGGEDRESKVQCNRSGAHRGDRDSQTETGRDAEVVAVDGDILFDGAEVAEGDAVDHVVGREW